MEIALGKDVPVVKTKLEVNLPIWTPQLYDGLTTALFDAVKLVKGAATASADTSTFSALTQLTAQTIEKENQAVSDSLAGDFNNPALHERAAVILGALALRENSGDFFEIRSPLCRITAHLAFVRGRNGAAEYGINGHFADAMLYTLMNNQKTALEKIAALDQSKPELAAWARALKTRNTHDQRVLENVKPATLLERIELFRARCMSVDTDIALQQLSDTDKGEILDWYRIINANIYSVEAGHIVQQFSLPLEMRELREVYRASKGSDPKPAQLIALLNQLPERCVSQAEDGAARVRVIGWGQWAMFCQRHLCHTLQHNFDFLENKWGESNSAAIPR